ncbi:Protein ECERIFERUM 16 [Linum perenne]
MDAKSLAKSKRAHSLHHSKKPHSSRRPKPASGSGSAGVGDGGIGGKSSENPVKDREQAASSALPSNWDRYEEELDLGSEEMSKTSDVVLPKSKGADYRHLLEEAQSQSVSSGYLNSSFSLDDIFPDEFNHTLGPMLSARGEGFMSWILDDNFIVEDDNGRTATKEASFLSLNLQALEEQLAKVDISKRLFIEPDILPPDLVTCGQDSAASQMSETAASTSIPEHSAQADIPEKDTKNMLKAADPIPDEPTSTVDDYFKPSFTQSQTSVPFQTTSPDSSTTKLKSFEASAAEAELDMLLDSFGDTKLDDPPTSSSGTFPLRPDSTTVLPRVARNVPSDFDDMLDNLLEETSSALNHSKPHQHSNTRDPKPLPPSTESSSSQPVSKSETLNDFGSWLDSI